MKLKAIASMLAIGCACLPSLTFPAPSTAGKKENTAPLLKNLINANGAESLEEAVLGLKSPDLVNFRSGHLRPPRWYDFSCNDSFRTTCYSNSQVSQVFYILFNCDGIDQNFYIPIFFLNETQEAVEYQFKNVLIADVLVGIPYCASRVIP